MTDDEILAYGYKASRILNDPTFLEFAEMWETTRFQAFMTTKPTEAAERDHVYAQIAGFRDFNAMLADIIKSAAEIQERYSNRLDDIDDPQVHEIYADIR